MSSGERSGLGVIGGVQVNYVCVCACVPVCVGKREKIKNKNKYLSSGALALYM